MEEKWIKDIKQKLDNHSRNVPADLWDRIERDIATPRKKAAFIPYRRIIIAAAAAIFAAIIIAPFLINNTPQFELEDTPQSIAENNPSIPSEMGSEHETPITFPTVSTTPITISSEVCDANLPDKTRATNEFAPECNQPVAQEPAVQQKQSHDTEKKAEKQSGKINPFEYNSHNSPTNIRKNRKQFKFNIAASNLMQASQRTHGYAELTAGTVFANVVTANGLPAGDSHPDRINLRDIMISNLNSTPETKIRHKFPIRFSITAQYPVNNIIGLETGLTYTYLSSTLTSGSAKNRYETRQTLHYIGLPVKTSFSIWRTGMLELYLTAGGMIEKCVSGKADTDYYVDDKLKHGTSENVMDRPLQFSVNGGAGIQASLTRHTALYIEPGANYYFNNGSAVKNIYKDKPLNFNFDFGFRITL